MPTPPGSHDALPNLATRPSVQLGSHSGQLASSAHGPAHARPWEFVRASKRWTALSQAIARHCPTNSSRASRIADPRRAKMHQKHAYNHPTLAHGPGSWHTRPTHDLVHPMFAKSLRDMSRPSVCRRFGHGAQLAATDDGTHAHRSPPPSSPRRHHASIGSESRRSLPRASALGRNTRPGG